MRAAGYDPGEMVTVLDVMSRDDERTAPHGLRSHPLTRERVRALHGALGLADPEVADASPFSHRPRGPGDLGPVLRHPEPEGAVHRERFADATADFLAVAAAVELDAVRPDAAHAMLTRHLALRPASGRGHFLLGEALRLRLPEGRRAPAVRAAYERAVELAPDAPVPVRTLGFLYLETGDDARAKALLERYLDLAPDAVDRRLVERQLERLGS